MSIRLFSQVLAACLVASETFGQQSDPELAKGIRLVEQGEYSQAIIVLDTASRRLDRRPQDKGLAAQAYLHLGIAYVAEGQDNLARGAFRDALTRQPGLSLSAFDVSPKVREVFQQVKNEIAQQKPAAKKGGSKAPLILGGLALVGGGVALAAGSGGGGSAPANVPTPESTMVTDAFTAATSIDYGRGYFCGPAHSLRLTQAGVITATVTPALRIVLWRGNCNVIACTEFVAESPSVSVSVSAADYTIWACDFNPSNISPSNIAYTLRVTHPR